MILEANYEEIKPFIVLAEHGGQYLQHTSTMNKEFWKPIDSVVKGVYYTVKAGKGTKINFIPYRYFVCDSKGKHVSLSYWVQEEEDSTKNKSRWALWSHKTPPTFAAIIPNIKTN